MRQEDCLFCKIVAGEIPATKIYEDEKFLAFLDINPNTEGMTLVIPKEHYDSYAFDMPDDVYTELMLVTKKVAKLLKKGLNVSRVALVMEGTGVNHAHIKLYPLHGKTEEMQEMWAGDRIYFDKYKGYISTQLGPQVNQEDLEAVAQKIKVAL